MYVRLAFAVAAHLEPEILVVDEVLAVGDVAFQQKCLGKMESVAAGGRTILFVSHNMVAVRALCTRAVLLTSGEVECAGLTDTVVDAYLATNADQAVLSQDRRWSDMALAPGNDRIRVLRVVARPRTQGETNVLYRQMPIALEFEYQNLLPGTKLILNMVLYTSEGAPAFESLSTDEPDWHGQAFPAGTYQSVCEVPGNLLNEGVYRLRILFLDDKLKHLYNLDEALVFSVHDADSRDIAFYGRFHGPVRPTLNWQCRRISNGPL